MILEQLLARFADGRAEADPVDFLVGLVDAIRPRRADDVQTAQSNQIGRASCRERVSSPV
jgi:hypothetical protein